MKEKILLINPAFSRQEEYNFWFSSLGTKANPPLGLAYIAAVCLKKGYSVEIIDALAEGLSLEKLKRRIIKADPTVVGVTATTPMAKSAFEVLSLVKGIKNSIFTVLGGPHISAEPLLTLNESLSLDAGVLGEGEETFVELVENYRQGLSGIKGTIFRANKAIVVNPQRPYISDINDIPMPAYHLLPMHLYSPSPMNYRNFPAMPLIASRGCPFTCLFCYKAIFGNSIRKLSPETVFSQAKYLKENYKIKEIHFYDDTFILDQAWVKEVCAYLEKLKISWWCNGRVDNVSEDILPVMKKAGCYRIYYGVESVNEKSLRLLKKYSSLDRIEKAFSLTRKYGIEAGAFMMLGIPGENGEDMLRSIDAILKMKADQAVWTVLTPYPGTEIYRDVSKYGILRKCDWKEYIMISNEPIFIPYSTTKEELRKYLTYAYRRIAFSPVFILNKLKDIFYSPKKIIFYTQGLFVLIKGIVADGKRRAPGSPA